MHTLATVGFWTLAFIVWVMTQAGTFPAEHAFRKWLSTFRRR